MPSRIILHREEPAPRDIALHTTRGRFGSGLVLTVTEVDGLAGQFLDSAYGSAQYANWPLDRRLEGFLQHHGLEHLADNGDLFAIICDRVMTNISGQHSRVSTGEARGRPWQSEP